MKNPQEFWNERYSKASFVYGTKPNVWFAACLNQLPQGRLLLPAEGEGRNAVHAAKYGWEVHCLDFSESAKQKAEQLAQEKKVTLASYQLVDLEQWSAKEHEARFDAVGLSFVHAPESWRHQLHQQVINSLKVGGHLILEAFEKQQLARNSGGPKNPAQLFSMEELQQDFKSLNMLIFKEQEVHLKEGNGHRGDAKVIRMFARKDS